MRNPGGAGDRTGRSDDRSPGHRRAASPVRRLLRATLRFDRGQADRRDTVRAWRIISSALILADAAFEAWREENPVFLPIGAILAAAYCAILPRLVRLAAGRQRPNRPV